MHAHFCVQQRLKDLQRPLGRSLGLFCAAGHPHLWTSVYYSHHLRVTNSNFCLLDSVRLLDSVWDPFPYLRLQNVLPGVKSGSIIKFTQLVFFSSSLRDHSFYNLYFPITTMTISYIYFIQFSYLFIAGNKNKVLIMLIITSSYYSIIAESKSFFLKKNQK